jgi:ankyrin repeat protein
MAENSIYNDVIALLTSINSLDERMQKYLNGIIKKIEQAENSGQIAYYLSQILANKSVLNALSPEEKANLATHQQRYLAYSQTLDRFGNPKLNAEFESMLSQSLLEHAPCESLATINSAIVDYLKRHKTTLLTSKESEFKKALIKFKIPYDTSVDPIDALIALLERPLNGADRAQVISETMSLHLLFFNYQNLYQPELDCEESQRDAIMQKRGIIHRTLRPKDKGQMFEEHTRGRLTVQSTKQSTTLGITDDESALDAFLNFHRHEFTPHKYRAKANENSPIVKAFRKQGISFIAGPSGTTADCLEGIHFLFPNFNFKQYEQYLNLLAAAEVAQGHHAMHEILLPALNANTLPKLATKMTNKPIWDLLPYGKTYELFLSDEFKALPIYQALVSRYPQYLDEMPGRQLDKAATAIQREIRSAQAAKEFHASEYWQEVDSQDPAMKVEPAIKNFIRSRSAKNLAKIKQSLGPLSSSETKFLRFFMAQEFDLTHYTNSKEAILASGDILSNSLLKRQLLRFDDHSSEGDIDKLNNGHYVFYRMELNHQYKAGSRFGMGQFVIKGRHSGLLESGNVSLFEMYVPRNASVLRILHYKDKLVRKNDITVEPRESIHLIYPETGKFSTLSIPGTVFHGRDIMPGIAYAMIRELRNIGSSMQDDFLRQFDINTFDIDSSVYQQMQQSANDMLGKLFRVEGKIPAKTVLANQDFEIVHVDEALSALKSSDPILLRAQFTPESINRPYFHHNGGQFNALEIAIINDYPFAVSWLTANGGQISSQLNIFSFFDGAFLKTCTVDSFKSRMALMPHLDVNLKDKSGKTLLHHMAANNRLDLIATAISLGIDPHITDDAGKSFMQDFSIINYLTSKKHVRLEDLNEYASFISLDQHSLSGSNLLHLVVTLQLSPEIINFFITHGVSIDEKSEDGRTPLEILQLNLISRARSINRASSIDKNQRIIHYFQTIKSLDINFKASFFSPSDERTTTLLLTAIDNENIDLVMFCLSQGAKVSALEHKALILMLSKLFSQQDIEIIDRIIILYPEASGFLNYVDPADLIDNDRLSRYIKAFPGNETSIYSGFVESSHKLLQRVTPEQVNTLLQHHPQLLSAVDSHGDTLLFHAAEAGRVDLFVPLIELGVNTAHTNQVGNTYLDKINLVPSVKKGDLDAIKRILSDYPQVKLDATHKGKRLMHFAAKHNQFDILDFLHDQGFSFDDLDAQGVSVKEAMQEALLEMSSSLPYAKLQALLSRYNFLTLNYRNKAHIFLAQALSQKDNDYIFFCLENGAYPIEYQPTELQNYLSELARNDDLRPFQRFALRFPELVDVKSVRPLAKLKDQTPYHPEVSSQSMMAHNPHSFFAGHQKYYPLKTKAGSPYNDIFFKSYLNFNE